MPKPIDLSNLSDTQRLVHLAARMTDDDVERIRQEILDVSRRAFEEEMTIQAREFGCEGNIGRLTTGPELTELNNQALRDAKSIVNTYNKDLTSAIKSVYAENKYANRNYYAKYLGKWDQARATRKSTQIAQFSESVGRKNAQAAFTKLNGLMGVATLVPSRAVCPVCIGWVARGQIPLAEAMDESPPYHTNCPHFFQLSYSGNEDIPCEDLWMGQ